MGPSSRNQGDYLRRCPGRDKQNGWWGVDRWAWGSDRHMPSTQETMFKNTHAEINPPDPRHGKLITMNAAAESKLGLWLSKKKKKRKREPQLTVPNFSLSAISSSPILGVTSAGPTATLNDGRCEEEPARNTPRQIQQ